MKILAKNLHFPEAPLVDKQGEIWCTELLAGAITRISAKKSVSFKLGKTANGMIEDAAGNFVVTDSAENTVRYFQTSPQQASLLFDRLSEGSQLHRPNDLCFDTHANLLVTCHADARTSPEGYLVTRTPTGEVKIISEQKYFPNGIAVNQTGDMIYFAETYQHRIWKASWDAEKAEILEEAVLAEVGGPIGPDGLCLDTEGNIYVTVFDQGKIIVVSPFGAILQTIPLPYSRPTSCAFHPHEPHQLLITDANEGVLYAIEVKAEGLPPFKGTISL